jgi:Protein of unknown function (DUF4239)
MNFYWVYDLSNTTFCLLTLGTFASLSLLGLWFTRPLARKVVGNHPQNDVVSYYLSAFGVFYGITAGLIAVATWQNLTDVETKVSNEASSVAALYRDISSFPNPIRTDLQNLMREYVRYVIEEAWPLQRKGLVPKGGTERITLFQERLAQFQPSTDNERAFFSEALSQFNNLILLRRLRLQAVTSGLPPIVWVVVLAGAALNILLTYCFVMERFALHACLTLFIAILIGLLVFLTAAMDNPFRGELSVTPEAFQIVHDQLMAVKKP